MCMSVGMRNVLAGEARLARVLAVGRAHREREEWARLCVGTIAFGCPVCHNQPRRSSRRDDGSGQMVCQSREHGTRQANPSCSTHTTAKTTERPVCVIPVGSRVTARSAWTRLTVGACMELQHTILDRRKFTHSLAPPRRVRRQPIHHHRTACAECSSPTRPHPAPSPATQRDARITSPHPPNRLHIKPRPQQAQVL